MFETIHFLFSYTIRTQFFTRYLRQTIYNFYVRFHIAFELYRYAWSG